MLTYDFQNASNSFMSSSSAIFLLVFKLTDENFEKRVEYWMHSIKAQGNKPAAILVGMLMPLINRVIANVDQFSAGTFLDDDGIKKKEIQSRVETMIEHLSSLFSKGFSKITWYLVANSAKNDTGLDNLRTGILVCFPSSFMTSFSFPYFIATCSGLH